MRRLTEFSTGNDTDAFQRLLDSEGIGNTVTIESMSIWTHRTEFIIWVDENAFSRAKALRESFDTAQRDADDNAAPTRVDQAGELSTRCKNCGYNLRGQTADGKCPECAHLYHIVKALRCPHCNATSPGDFELCWKCGGELIASA